MKRKDVAAFADEVERAIENGIGNLSIFQENAATAILVVQHKWLLEPDRVNETKANNDQLEDGIAKAKVARNYIRQNPLSIKDTFGLPDAPKGIVVEGIAVVRGLEPSGSVFDQEVPVVSELWLNEQFTAGASLESIYRGALERPDHTEASRIVEEKMGTTSIAGYTFRWPALAFPVVPLDGSKSTKRYVSHG
jgi:hypothetical protein